MLTSPFKEDAIKFGGTTEEDLKRFAEAFERFPTIQDACITVVFYEMIAKKPGAGGESARDFIDSSKE